MSTKAREEVSTATQKPVDAHPLDALEHNVDPKSHSSFLSQNWDNGNPELADIIVIKCINVEPHNSNDRVVVICSCGHGDLLLLMLTVDHTSL